MSMGFLLGGPKDRVSALQTSKACSDLRAHLAGAPRQGPLIDETEQDHPVGARATVRRYVIRAPAHNVKLYPPVTALEQGFAEGVFFPGAGQLDRQARGRDPQVRLIDGEAHMSDPVDPLAQPGEVFRGPPHARAHDPIAARSLAAQELARRPLERVAHARPRGVRVGVVVRWVPHEQGAALRRELAAQPGALTLPLHPQDERQPRGLRRLG